MDGQVLGGGVIVLVAVLLWLVYLVPTWNARRQYDAAERNAVRLNQAIRILAETSETPDEVRLELSARTASQQQKLAKRLQAERAASELAELRESLEVARQAPAARRARARRRARAVATVVLLAGLATVGWGVWQTVQSGSQVALWSGTGVTLLAFVMLQQMHRVQVRAGVRAASTVALDDQPSRTAVMQDVELPAAERTLWTPRTLPQPLSAAAGSRAATQLDAVDARAALRRAAQEEALRARAEAEHPAPVRLGSPRPAQPAEASPYAQMGMVDDAEIEAHVRDLLRKRAVG